MKSQVGVPAIIIAVVVVVGLIWVFFSRAMAPAAPVIAGSDIQKPTGLQPDPADMPPGGKMGGNGPAEAAGGKVALPPGKGKH